MKRRFRLLTVATLLALVAGASVWFAFFRDKGQRPAEESPKPKTTAELLIGSWKEVQPGQSNEPALFEVVLHFKQDGKYELSTWDSIRGPRVAPGTYRLHENTLQFSPASATELSPIRGEIWERTSIIETLTEEQLIIVTITRRRWTQEMAEQLADVRGVPVGPLLAEVREDRSRSLYVRLKDE